MTLTRRTLLQAAGALLVGWQLALPVSFGREKEGGEPVFRAIRWKHQVVAYEPDAVLSLAPDGQWRHHGPPQNGRIEQPIVFVSPVGSASWEGILA